MTGQDRLPCLVTTAELLAYEAKLGKPVSFSPSLPSAICTSQQKTGVGRMRRTAARSGHPRTVQGLCPYQQGCRLFIGPKTDKNGTDVIIGDFAGWELS